jgi:tetratricopeptide (TPR) repeat protein
MEKGTSTMRRYLRDSTPGQRKAALIAALMLALLLVASISFFFVHEMDLLRPDPTSAAELQYLRARDAEGDAIAAARADGTSIDTSPAVVTARLNIANAQLSLGQTTAAARTIDAVVRSNPYNIRALILQGNIYEISNNNEEALEVYRRVLDKTEGLESEMQREALRGVGQSLAALGDNVQALDALARAALIQPESITLHIAAGELALSIERWQVAATHFYSVLRFEPTNERALEHLRMLEREHSDQARAALEALTSGTAYPQQESP